MDWTPKQMMAIALSRLIEDEKLYVIGTGLPLLSATLAKNTHAPNAKFIFETALFEGSPLEVPTSVSDMRINYKASVLWPQYRYFGFLSLAASRGMIASGFLGGAQIDPYGNLNSTSIGDYFHPDVRFTGSGGANGIATYCNSFIIMKHEKRRFVEKVDYITSPGWIDRPNGRSKHGLMPDCGPLAVITEMGVMRFGDDKRLYLSEFFHGVTAKQVADNTGFSLDVSRAVESAPPDLDALRILVEQVDRTRLMI